MVQQAILLVFLSLTASLYGAKSPEIGKAAPNFSLKGDDGKNYKLSDFKGKLVVLEWFNNDCPYVDKHYHEEYRNMQTLQEKWIKKAAKSGQELVWFTIASSAPGKQGHMTPEQSKKIRMTERKAKMTAMLLDPKGDVGRKYNARTTPHMFIIDTKGVLQYDGAIDDKSKARVSSLKGAKNYVSAALDQLLAGQKPKIAKTKPYGCSVKY